MMRYGVPAVSPSALLILIAFVLVLLAVLRTALASPLAPRIDLAWLGMAFFLASFLVR